MYLTAPVPHRLSPDADEDEEGGGGSGGDSGGEEADLISEPESALEGMAAAAGSDSEEEGEGGRRRRGSNRRAGASGGGSGKKRRKKEAADGMGAGLGALAGGVEPGDAALFQPDELEYEHLVAQLESEPVEVVEGRSRRRRQVDYAALNDQLFGMYEVRSAPLGRTKT